MECWRRGRGVARARPNGSLPSYDWHFLATLFFLPSCNWPQPRHCCTNRGIFQSPLVAKPRQLHGLTSALVLPCGGEVLRNVNVPDALCIETKAHSHRETIMHF